MGVIVPQGGGAGWRRVDGQECPSLPPSPFSPAARTHSREEHEVESQTFRVVQRSLPAEKKSDSCLDAPLESLQVLAMPPP